MQINAGTADRIVRVLIGLVAAYLGYVTTGAWHWILYAVAAIALVTAVTGFCLIYRLLGISTCRRT